MTPELPAELRGIVSPIPTDGWRESYETDLSNLGQFWWMDFGSTT